ncbi:enoyl-CoA hydratase/isomerase family [Actinidia rufa]|uniref:Enoyl-CoA hydratase/isomerase family n=1 Tax=Actinidia rufa TaxID=165716 RepID=A0A7J0E2W0_9ERIC|nr:enoyl-CoA hydratase/isomerase family [Actinidia rufa]
MNTSHVEYQDQVLELLGYDPGIIDELKKEDLVGYGVALAVEKEFASAFPGHTFRSTLVELLVKSGRNGKNNEKGYYLYEKGSKPKPDPSVFPMIEESRQIANILPAGKPISVTDQEIVEMILFPVVNEACRVLEEGVVVPASDLDIASVLGMSFPRFGTTASYCPRFFFLCFSNFLVMERRFVRASSMVEAIISNQTHGGEADTSKGMKDKTRVTVSPIETRFTRVDVTVADSGERLDIGEHNMEHEVGDLKGRLGEPRGNMQATVNSMVHVGQQGRLSFQLKVLDKGKSKDRKPKNNCFICDELHFFRDCPKREELQARIKEYEERQRLEEEPTISEPEEDSTSTKVDRSKETVEVLEDFKDLVSLESPKGFPPKGKVDYSIELEMGADISGNGT